jgi:16S rRNA (uracil1498-N3)-methyltransferase
MKTAQRLMVSSSLAAGVEITLDPGQSHYLANVLRLAVSAEVLLFDGANGEWASQITIISKKAVTLTCQHQTRVQDAVPALSLAFAPIKGDRLEAIVEKATELGAARLIPVITERTIVRKVRLDRLVATAVEAAEQTGRLSVPVIDAPVFLEQLLADADLGTVLFADEAGEAITVSQALADRPQSVTLLVGPEGGFTPSERQRLRASPSVVPVHLGPRILRADTACFAGLALVQAGWGDW